MELTIESITTGEKAVAPDQLSDEQKTFLTDNADKLDDATAEKYGVTKTAAPYVPEDPDKDKKIEEHKEGEDDEMDEDEKGKITKLVHKEMSSFVQQTQSTAQAVAVDSFIQSKVADMPSASKYRQAMIDTLKIPAYSHLKPNEVFNIVAGSELMRIGAERERETSAKVKGTQVRSSTARVPSGQKDWGSASKEEFEAKKAEVAGRG
jgi:hypothetical protein